MASEATYEPSPSRFVAAEAMTGDWRKAPDLPPLPQGPVAKEAGPLRVCIATYDLAGPIRCGSVGSAFTALATSLAEAGNEVTILYMLGDHAESRSIGYWVDHYRELGVCLVPLPELPPRTWSQSAGLLATSYAAYRWLREQHFDVIHFSEWQAPGFCSLTAKHQGLAFAETTLVVGVHGPSRWSLLANIGCFWQVRQLEIDFMERRSVELADVAWAPSQYLIRWMLANRWPLPARCHVQPNIVPQSARGAVGEGAVRSRRQQPSDHLVFFGRLEARKGIVRFCDALDLLARQRSADFEVTFLGRSGFVGEEPGEEFVRRRGGRWPFPWRVITDRNPPEAIDYLCQPGRMAVIPALVDNLPVTVLECLGHAIPFISTPIGGIPEMIAEEDRSRVLCGPGAEDLARRLERALSEGLRPARPAVDQEENEEAWRRWHASLPRAAAGCDRWAPPAPAPPPKVSICMATHDRTRLLRQAIESVEGLDYPDYELILVDDGSTDPEAVALLDELSESFPRRGWQVVRQENRYPSAARNNAARHASGQYLLFMDDDNCAMPHELAALVRVARKTGADIVTSHRVNFEGDDPPRADKPSNSMTLYLGGALVPGLFRNVYGDMNSLVRREAFFALGGLPEENRLGSEDWEFFCRAVLAGRALEVAQDPVYFYRVCDAGHGRQNPKRWKARRATVPYRQAAPEALRDLILLAQGVFGPGRTSGPGGAAEEGPRTDYRALPGLHLLRIGLRNCIREGPRRLLWHLRRKLGERLRGKDR